MVLKCEDCGSVALIHDYDRGEVTCSKCGIVQSRIYDYHPEWRSYDEESNKQRSRAGLPISMLRDASKGLRTQIVPSAKDATGSYLSIEKRHKFQRLSVINEREKIDKARNLRHALAELKRLKGHLNLSENTAKVAILLYKKALDKDLVRGRSIDALITACVYLACRKTHTPIGLKDVMSVTNVPQKDLGRSVRLLLLELDINVEQVDYITLINKIARSLKLSNETIKEACNIFEMARNHANGELIVGKNPMNIAAACVYLASVRTGEKRTQEQVAACANTTPVTVRNRFREFVNVLKLKNVTIKRGAAARPVYKR